MLAWFKFRTRIPSSSGVCVQREWQKYTPPSPSLSKDEGIKNIGHSTSIRNLIFGVNSVTVSYLIRYDSLLQNATAILLQNATEVYYKMRQIFYYKMRRLLQIATVHRIILARWKLRFTRIDEMIISLTLYSLQYKPMPIILWTTPWTFKLCCFEGMMFLILTCINTVSGLPSWRVG